MFSYVKIIFKKIVYTARGCCLGETFNYMLYIKISEIKNVVQFFFTDFADCFIFLSDPPGACITISGARLHFQGTCTSASRYLYFLIWVYVLPYLGTYTVYWSSGSSVQYYTLPVL